jgi:hypothetical protein
MRASIAAAVLILIGCVSTNATLLGTSTAVRPKLAPEVVRIYRTADQVKGKYEEVALINASGESGSTSEATMLEAMRKKAAQVGANGLILDAISEPSAGAKIAGVVFGTGSERKGKAVAIFIFPDSSSQ